MLLRASSAEEVKRGAKKASLRTRHHRPGRAARRGRPVQAIWNGTVIAQSERTVIVEGNHYFPPEDVNREYLEPSARRSTCPWKGRASYYDVVIDGQRNNAAAWHYPTPTPAARRAKDRVAFWHGIKVRRAAQD